MTVTISCADADSGIASCTPPATILTGSTWTVPTEGLFPGLYAATARSVDVAGNQSAASREVRFLALACLPDPR